MNTAMNRNSVRLKDLASYHKVRLLIEVSHFPSHILNLGSRNLVQRIFIKTIMKGE